MNARELFYTARHNVRACTRHSSTLRTVCTPEGISGQARGLYNGKLYRFTYTEFERSLVKNTFRHYDTPLRERLARFVSTRIQDALGDNYSNANLNTALDAYSHDHGSPEACAAYAIEIESLLEAA